MLISATTSTGLHAQYTGSPNRARDTEVGQTPPGEELQTQRKYSPEDEQRLDKLKETDRKVRAHEQAHLAAGGGLVRGGASFDYERGPDGKMYAVGGEVQIDASPVRGDPEATVEKAERIVRAAMAPADPSPQDQSVAAQAGQMAMQARLEMAREEQRQATSPDSSLRENADPSMTNGLDKTISDMTGDTTSTIGRLLAVA